MTPSFLLAHRLGPDSTYLPSVPNSRKCPENHRKGSNQSFRRTKNKPRARTSLRVRNANNAIPLATSLLFQGVESGVMMNLQPVLLVVVVGLAGPLVELHVRRRRRFAATLQEKRRGRAAALLHLGRLRLGRGVLALSFRG